MDEHHRAWGLDAPEQLRALRHDLADELEARSVPPRTVADAVLVATELATNALRYAGGHVDVHLMVNGDGVEITVRDDDDTPLPPPLPVDADRVGGNGLRLVEAFSTVWGARVLPGEGKEVWFRMEPGA